MWTTPVDSSATDVHRYGPRPGLFVVGALLAAAAAVAIVLANGPQDRVVAVVLLLFIAATMVAALRMRPRLQASSAGLVVGTVSGRREIRWAQVHRIEVVSRKRLGTTSSSLELDLDDDELVVFGRMDLGADPDEVADTLRALRTGRTR